VRHKPLGSGFQNGKKIKIQAEEQMRGVKADTEKAKVGVNI
jgi:hypothetical protein